MKFKKILNAMLALLVACMILLVSDLENRHRESKVVNDKTSGDYVAQAGRTYKLGVTYIGPDPALDVTLEAIWDEMAKYGYVKDSNLIVQAQHANGEMANLQPLHFAMDHTDVDAILVLTTPGISAAVATVKNHPMVFSLSYTPLIAGAGKSYTDHLPNITGVGSFPPVEKTMDFIRETIPHTKRIGTVYNSSEANSVRVMEVAKEYLKGIGIELVESTATNSNEVYQAISSLCNRKVDVVWITGDNTAIQAFPAIGKVCKDNELPLIINDDDFMGIGALASVGISWRGTGRRTAPYIAKVLSGYNPGEIPIENYVEETCKLDKELAANMGITFPQQYLDMAEHKTVTFDKKLKLCLAHYVDSPNSEDAEHGIKEQLAKNGLKEGEDYTLKTYNAQGDISTLNSIAETIAGSYWDLVFTTSTPTIQAISKKIEDRPIVFTNVGDPIKAGMGESFENHVAHCTGISTMSDFEGLVQLIKETVPNVKTIATVFTPGEVNSVAYNDKLKEVAEAHGLTLISVPANSATEVSDAAMSAANSHIDAFAQISDNLTASCGAAIIKVAYDKHIPYFGFISKQVEQGAVAAIARDYYYAGVDAVNMAMEVLTGTSPQDIPFRYVTKSTVHYSEKAEKYFNVTIPQKYK